jgi:hypothetical protein
MNLAFEWLQHFGSGGSTEVKDTNLGFPLTTAWQKFTYTINLPSLSGKTVGSGSSFRLRFVPTSTDAVFASRWGANGNFTGTVDLALVQVESGDKSTPFEHRSYGEELGLCQRYYESVYDGPVITSHPVANASIGTNGYREALIYIKFATPKRSSNYTMTGYRWDNGAPNFWLVNISGANLALSPTFTPKTTQGCRAYVGSASLPLFGVAELYYNWVCSDEL